MRQVVGSSMELDEGIEVTIDGYVISHTESDYGSDADGRRGVKRTFVDDVINIQAYDKDMCDVPLSPDELDRAAEILTREFLEG